ncbi:MAG TPA: LLM class flavin-dependent oxidoreductase [Pseudolabrys sp.]|nr:LLM class flavin-dependent oxidoreductase [Pseudolabrys sp.]
MARLPKISIRLHGGMTPAACVELAKAAERAGFAGLWFAENAFARGIMPAAAACALATERLTINAGVFNPFGRHPTMIAMEIGALDELSRGRTTLSLGSGIASATEKIGFDPAKPLPAMRDTLTIVRALLCGKEVDHAGPAFSARRVKLGYTPRPDIPIYLAGRGDLAVKLAGELADGVLISNMCSVAFAARAAALMQSRRKAAGRTGRGEVVQYMPCSVRRDPDAALAAGKRAVGEMLPGFWALGQRVPSAKEALLAGVGISEAEFAAVAVRLRAGEDAADVLDARYAQAFSLVGTPEDCLAAAERYAEAGVSELALTFDGPSAIEAIETLSHALAGRVQGAEGRE